MPTFLLSSFEAKVNEAVHLQLMSRWFGRGAVLQISPLDSNKRRKIMLHSDDRIFEHRPQQRVSSALYLAVGARFHWRHYSEVNLGSYGSYQHSFTYFLSYPIPVNIDIKRMRLFSTGSIRSELAKVAGFRFHLAPLPLFDNIFPRPTMSIRASARVFCNG